MANLKKLFTCSTQNDFPNNLLKYFIIQYNFEFLLWVAMLCGLVDRDVVDELICFIFMSHWLTPTRPYSVMTQKINIFTVVRTLITKIFNFMFEREACLACSHLCRDLPLVSSEYTEYSLLC